MPWNRVGQDIFNIQKYHPEDIHNIQQLILHFKHAWTLNMASSSTVSRCMSIDWQTTVSNLKLDWEIIHPLIAHCSLTEIQLRCIPFDVIIICLNLFKCGQQWTTSKTCLDSDHSQVKNWVLILLSFWLLSPALILSKQISHISR